MKTKITKEIESEILSQWENRGWAHTELYLRSKGFNYEEIEIIHDRLAEGKSLYPYPK